MLGKSLFCFSGAAVGSSVSPPMLLIVKLEHPHHLFQWSRRCVFMTATNSTTTIISRTSVQQSDDYSLQSTASSLTTCHLAYHIRNTFFRRSDVDIDSMPSRYTFDFRMALSSTTRQGLEICDYSGIAELLLEFNSPSFLVFALRSPWSFSVFYSSP